MIQPTRTELAKWNRLTREQPNGCVLFLGPSGADGYGRWKPGPGQPTVYAHVWAYQVFTGDIPEGHDVDHVCHTEAVQRGECDGGPTCVHRRCVRHLEVVTRSENTLRQNHANRGKTECGKCGRPLDGDNLVVWADGKRRCRHCLTVRRSGREQVEQEQQHQEDDPT